jgi:integrase
VGLSEQRIEIELARVSVEFEAQVKSCLCTDGNIRFETFAERWLSANENNLAPSTVIRYQSLLTRINAAIGHMKIKDLRAHHLQEFYKNLAEDGISKRGGGLSAKTILHHHRLISVILGDAYRQGYALRDVSELVTPPKVRQRDIAFLDDKDALRFVDALRDAPIKWRTALLLLLFTGIRRGELVGLEWGDIDFTAGVIHIRRTAQYLCSPKLASGARKGRIIEKETKTKSSARSIAVDGSVTALLSEYRRWWTQQRATLGDAWIETNKVFITDFGGIMHPDSVTDYLVKFTKSHGLPRITPHGLRHSNISLMISAGVNIATVSSRAGHASISTTANIYTHAIQAANAKAAEKIGSILNVDNSVDKAADNRNVRQLLDKSPSQALPPPKAKTP